MKWSKYQQDIFNNVKNGTGHTIVSALAGTGKTSSVIEAFKHIPSGKTTLMVAFNKSIATELKDRAPSYVDCSTLHSLGLRSVKRSLGEDIQIDKDKCKKLIDKRLKTLARDKGINLKTIKYDLIQSTNQCVSLCKATLADAPADIESIIEEYSIEIFDLELSDFITLVIKVMGDCKKDKVTLDFDDMIWFPFIFRLKMKLYDFVFVDECQDLNKSQMFMVLSSCKKGGRIIAIGDQNQCVAEETVVETKNGSKLIKDITIGDEVLSFKNGTNQYQKVINKKLTSEKLGLKIITESGRSLSMTYGHQIWVSESDKGLYLSLITNKSSQVKETVIHFMEHNFRSSIVSIEWSDNLDNLSELLDTYNIKYNKFNGSDRCSIKRYFDSNRDALAFALLLKKASGCKIKRTLASKKDSTSEIILTNAASLSTDMKVVIRDRECYKLEDIKSIECVKSNFYDIEVDNSCNFYGNEILSHNCIYGFRGAHQNMMDTLKNKLSAKEFQLPITYRCPKKVVYFAQKAVPHYTHAPDAPMGSVEYISNSQLLDKVQPGDFILSRTNSPLIKNCLKLLRRGVPANIQGRDVGKNLIWFVKKSKKKTLLSFINYVNIWRDTEVNRLKDLGRSPQYYIDKADCLLTLCDSDNNIKDTDDLIKIIKKLFDDNDDNSKVILSTSHRAKGLERDRVFMLSYTYRVSSKNIENTPSEERNIWYVSVTRAKKSLYMVSKD